MPKFRVEVMVDVYTEHLFAEVEADDAQHAKELAKESLKEQIGQFVKGTVEDAGWDIGTEVAEEPDSTSPSFVKGEWDRIGQSLEEISQ